MEKKSKTLLAISAHPDDIEFGCVGTIMKFIDEGYEAFVIVATNGESGFKISHKPKKERIKTRRKEQLNAANKLGAKKVYFLEYKDGFLKSEEDLKKKLVNIIREVKPEIIFSFDPANRNFDDLNIHHCDHRNISEAVFDAVFAAKNRYLYPGTPHVIDRIFFYAPGTPNHFENITNTIEKKLNILKEHKSQFEDFTKAEAFLKNYFSSVTKKYKYAEPFRIMEIKKKF